jgi:ABC-type Mn2+/Zn2+ transport system permease subunit
MIDWLTDPLAQRIVVRALAELVLLGVVSGTLGCWIVLAGRSYSAESLAHAMLPGLVGAALLGVPLLLGGALGLLVASVSIALVGRVPRLDGDVAVSVVITGLFGLGVLLGLAPEVPAGLGSLLFGDVLGVSDGDVLLAGALAVIMVGVLGLAHHSLLAVWFDRLNARALGRSPAALDVLLALLLAAAMLVAVQALGTLLVVAMLVGPAATARLITRRVAPMMAAATAIAAGASVAGLWASYHAGIAAGASVTLALCAAFALALLGRPVVHAARAALPRRAAA